MPIDVTIPADNALARTLPAAIREVREVCQSVVDSGVLEYPNVTNLQALRGSVSDAPYIHVHAHTTPADGGHGDFRRVTGAAAGTYVDNNGTIILPTADTSGACAWIRVEDITLTPEMFGATGDGVANDRAALNALNGAVRSPALVGWAVANKRYLIPGLDYVVSPRVQWKGSRVATDSSRIGWMTSGSTFIVDPAVKIKIYEGAGLDGLVFMRQGMDTTAMDADDVLLYSGSCLYIAQGQNTLKNLTILGFETGIVVDSLVNHVRSTFEDIKIDCTNGINYVYDGGMPNFTRVRCEPILTGLPDANNVRTGTGLYIEDAVGAQITDCFMFNDTGYHIHNTPNVVSINSWSDGPRTTSYGIGMKITGTSDESVHTAFRASSHEIGVQIDTPNTTTGDYPRTHSFNDVSLWQNDDYGMQVLQGTVHIIGGNIARSPANYEGGPVGGAGVGIQADGPDSVVYVDGVNFKRLNVALEAINGAKIYYGPNCTFENVPTLFSGDVRPIGAINANMFGAKADGVTDDTLALQAALDFGVPIQLSVGVYRTTAELVLKNGSKIIGAGNWSAFTNTAATLASPLKNMETGTTVIRYDGEASAAACVVRASSVAVGVEPTDTDTRNLVNIGMSGVVLDGNGKAGIGLYVARGLTNNIFNDITVTRTMAHGFLVMVSFIGQANNWVAYLNEGCGITIGRNIYSWASNNVTVDEFQFNSLFAFYNGHDETRALLSQYEPAVPTKEYGIGFGQGRAVKFINAQSANNGGVGIYVEADRWPVNFDTYYTENNCQSIHTSNVGEPKYGIWIQGVAGANSRHIQFSNGYMSGPGPTAIEYDGIRLTGTEPSRLGEDAVIFSQIPLLKHINADWGNYRLLDCDSSVVVTGSNAYQIPPVVNGFINLSLTGYANFTVSGAAITGLTKGGVIEDVTYTGTGDYDVTFSENLTTLNYGVMPGGSENRSIGIANKGVGGFQVKSKALTTGTATDSAFVSLAVIGGYTL